MTPPSLIFFQLILSIFAQRASSGGKWTFLHKNVGIPAMHVQLLNNDKVIMYDRTDAGPSPLRLPNGKCRLHSKYSPNPDCSTHSIEYDPILNAFRPLMLQTDVWCSSAYVNHNGTLIQSGGWDTGARMVRSFRPCQGCDWVETPNGLNAPRWYATSQALPDGTQIIIGGRSQFNYEFYPKTPSTRKLFTMTFLLDTFDSREENNLYPLVFLNVDGNLFIFANNRAILFNYRSGETVNPKIPGSDPRSYPSTGSGVILPVMLSNGLSTQAEVLICGGSRNGSYQDALKGKFRTALDTCARIEITDPSPAWKVETMPTPRIMSDMILLPNGDVLIINGASAGAAGWELGRSPVLTPVVYNPNLKMGSRFKSQNPTAIPRMYHSTAVLLRDGRVLIGGSNPHPGYMFKAQYFPTELSLEAFSPEYLDETLAGRRPKVVAPDSHAHIKYGQVMDVQFSIPSGLPNHTLQITMVSPSFHTHSIGMSQKVVILGNRMGRPSGLLYRIQVRVPGSPNLAPPGFYMLHVVNQGIPSEGVWVHIQ